MEIRALTAAEKPAAQRLAMEVFLNSDGLGFSEQGMHSVFEFIEGEAGQLDYLGAFDPDLTGMLAYDPEHYHLALCFVKQEKQGQGLGHALLEAFLDLAEKNHAARITVNAAPSACHVYESAGFEKCGPETETDGVRSVPMEFLLGKKNLGRTVTVTVDRPYGSLHEHYPDTVYTANFGYVEECLKEEGEFQDAYVIGPAEPVERFTGEVRALIYHADDDVCRWVVADHDLSRQEIIDAVGFQEQYHDVRIIEKPDKKLN
ncbi:MAG: GNAT family N-acetyltransferase [Solobacterium sp.]|nr:GNAT family N-acetyltransferase [Solobacterium sp.]